MNNDFEHRFTTVEGLRMHSVSTGPPEADLIVLLAGFPESWYAWRKVMPLLAETYRVLALDLPGQGDSDRPLDGYDTEALAGKLHELLEALGHRSYFLAAHDVGAWVAFPFAHLYGSEVRALALLDAGIPGVTLPDQLPTAPDRAWRTWHFAFHALPDLPETLITGREREYLDWFLRRKVADPTVFAEADMEEYLRTFRSPGGLRAGLAPYRAATLSASQNRALVAHAKLAMPVLALTADQGSILDMAYPLRAFAEKVLGRVIADCGHFQPEEQPDAVAHELRQFFNSERQSKGRVT
jgi:pimeloyl-ACP methyl ester carboxylesterase